MGDSFIQSPILNPLDQTDTNSPIKMYYLPKPDSGNYTIAVSSTDKPFEAASYLYDKNGNPKIQSLNGFEESTYSVSLNKEDFTKSQVTRVITFESTIQDIKDAQSLQLIDNGLATSLMEMVKNAQKQSDDHKKTSIVLLTNGINFLEKNQDSINSHSVVGYNILFEDLTTLRDILQ